MLVVRVGSVYSLRDDWECVWVGYSRLVCFSALGLFCLGCFRILCLDWLQPQAIMHIIFPSFFFSGVLDLSVFLI